MDRELEVERREEEAEAEEAAKTGKKGKRKQQVLTPSTTESSRSQQHAY